MDIESFKTAFSDNAGSCRVECACGKEYYNPDGGWSWEDGELEALASNHNAKALEWSAGYISFEGTTYAIDCTCWHERANRIMGFLDTHANKVAEYFREERRRKQAEADAVPNI